MKQKKDKVVHITSAHPRNDIRIAVKMCSSLVKEGFDVSLIVADGKDDEEINGYKVYDVGKSNGRINRIASATHRAYLKAASLKADIYHLHDPELLLYALKLKKIGKVIFDSHEDVPKQILCKPYLNKPLLIIVSKLYNYFEKKVCSKLDHIVTATPHIRDIFLEINKNTTDINNYPILDEFKIRKWEEKDNIVSYIGGISEERGCFAMVRAMTFVKNDIKLHLAGVLQPSNIFETLEKEEGWDKSKYLGLLKRQEVDNLLGQSKAGLVTLLPSPRYVDALATKKFEYMATGIPVIASNFPLWKEIIEGNSCGICVDPLNPQEIAEAIDWLCDNPSKASEMGENGRNAVELKYNWANENKKLLDIYKFVRKIKL
jgi:glycosyltransferase involved in cell wall biosynthesis